MSDTWSETKLWKAIEDSADDSVTVTVKNCLPRAEAVLRSGGTTPIDFTLHDAGHSFRVAERIYELLPTEPALCLSHYETALALMAAYLHDIGMSPGREQSRALWTYLVTGDQSLLDATEIDDLQAWLDREYGGLIPPIEDRPTASGLRQTEQIFAYYCRFKHNDWSEDWIRRNLARTTPGLYPTWADDLVTLCRSHHETLADLRGARFDAKIAGAPSRPINLRFLAALLRMADILEFDPERTPEVILQHRDIAPASRIFWHKDHAISTSLRRDNRQILFAARTPNAAVHKAVLDTESAINDELSTCVVLEQEGAFQRGAVSNDDRQKYHWHWPARLNSDIREKDESFVFIRGDFRPDMQKILRLLSGTQLYGHPLAAIRELIQNAVDAVLEQIALERLQQSDPKNPKLPELLGELHTMRLSLERDGDSVWLSCSDDGVGMTREVIEKHLLVSGSGVRAEIRALERAAANKGFSIGRTGQFGIGLISYFMLCDRLEITTRRSSEAGDHDQTGWRFITDGLTSFGELTRASRSSKGSEVRLRLKSSTVENAQDWFSTVMRYVKHTFRHSPCRFELAQATTGETVWVADVGWTSHVKDNAEAIISAQRWSRDSHSPELRTKREAELAEQHSTRWAEIDERVATQIRWFGPHEVDLPNAMGIARVCLPHFLVGDSASLAYFDQTGQGIGPLPGQDALIPEGQSNVSWRGFRVPVPPSFRRPSLGVIDVNIVKDAEISIDRHTLTSPLLADVSAFLEETVSAIAQEFLRTHSESNLDLVNRAIAAQHGIVPAHRPSILDKLWPTIESDHSGDWRLKALRLPVIAVAESRYLSQSRAALEVDDTRVTKAAFVSIDRWHRVLRLDQALGGGRLVAAQDSLALLWEKESDVLPSSDLRAEFPEEFAGLTAVVLPHRAILNRDHWLVQMAHSSGAHPRGRFVAQDAEAAIGDAAASAAQIILLLQGGANFAEAVKDNFPNVYKRLFASVGGGTASERSAPIQLLIFREAADNSLVEADLLRGTITSSRFLMLNGGVFKWGGSPLFARPSSARWRAEPLARPQGNRA